MIQAGRSIMTKDDLLTKIKPEYLYHKLINPDTDIESSIRQLRIVRQLDPKQYGALKRNLPYVVCGIFNPPVRRTENFAYTEYFIIDIDNITEKEMDVDVLRKQLEQDSRIMLCFLSPGEDGLKIMFKLKERCYDAGIYSLFYRLFTKQFSAQYNLDQVLDSRTCDVARACFISMDMKCYYEPQVETVDINAYLNIENESELFSIKKALDAEAAGAQNISIKTDETGNPDEEAINKIKSLLNPNLKTKIEKKEVYVPNELNDFTTRLLPYLNEVGITVSEVSNIHYGKKLKMKINFKEAEINIFFGKRGYSVVQSPRKGTDDKLNELCAELISQFLLQ